MVESTNIDETKGRNHEGGVVMDTAQTPMLTGCSHLAAFETETGSNRTREFLVSSFSSAWIN